MEWCQDRVQGNLVDEIGTWEIIVQHNQVLAAYLCLFDALHPVQNHLTDVGTILRVHHYDSSLFQPSIREQQPVVVLEINHRVWMAVQIVWCVVSFPEDLTRVQWHGLEDVMDTLTSVDAYPVWWRYTADDSRIGPHIRQSHSLHQFEFIFRDPEVTQTLVFQNK